MDFNFTLLLGNNDFTAITQDVGPFSNTQQRQCLFVEITNDAIPEETENFFFDLTARPGEVLAPVTIRPAVAEVTISGNNCESVPPPHSIDYILYFELHCLQCGTASLQLNCVQL